MSEELLREFFAQCKLLLHINLGFYCERNRINKSEFSLFMNNRVHHLNIYDLNLMKNDLLDNIELTLKSLKNIG